jgi:hypothetical protein
MHKSTYDKTRKWLLNKAWGKCMWHRNQTLHLHSPTCGNVYRIIKELMIGEKYFRVPEALAIPVQQQYTIFPY